MASAHEDRAAFTGERSFQKLQSQPPSRYNVFSVAFGIWKVIEAGAGANVAGEKYQVQIHDWHTKNVAFTDSDPCEVKLLDLVLFENRSSLEGCA